MNENPKINSIWLEWSGIRYRKNRCSDNRLRANYRALYALLSYHMLKGGEGDALTTINGIIFFSGFCVCSSLVSDGRGANPRYRLLYYGARILSLLPFVARCSKPFRMPRYARRSYPRRKRWLRERERPRHNEGGKRGPPRGEEGRGGRKRTDAGARISACILTARVLFPRIIATRAAIEAVVTSPIVPLGGGGGNLYAVHMLLSLARVNVLHVFLFPRFPPPPSLFKPFVTRVNACVHVRKYVTILFNCRQHSLRICSYISFFFFFIQHYQIEEKNRILFFVQSQIKINLNVMS